MEMVKLFGGLMLSEPSYDEMTASFNSGSSMEKCQLHLAYLALQNFKILDSALLQIIYLC